MAFLPLERTDSCRGGCYMEAGRETKEYHGIRNWALKWRFSRLLYPSRLACSGQPLQIAASTAPLKCQSPCCTIQSLRETLRCRRIPVVYGLADLFFFVDVADTAACFFLSRSTPQGLLAASPDIRAGNWRDGFPRVYHALDALLSSGEGQEKAGGWGGSPKVDGIGVGCTIVTALLDRKRGQV